MSKVYEVINTHEHVYHYLFLGDGVNMTKLDDMYSVSDVGNVSIEDTNTICRVFDVIKYKCSDYGPSFSSFTTQESLDEYVKSNLSH